MKSTPEQPKKSSPLHFLLLGPPGAGKTVLCMQFPDVCFMDCDSNLDGPERFLRKRNPKLSYSFEPIRYDDEGKPVPVEEAFDRLMDKLTAVKSDASIRTVVIDGLTHVNEFIIRNVLHLQRKAKNPNEMEARDWIPFKSKAYQLLVGKLQGLGKTTICCCHERKIEESDPSNMMKPKIVGYEPAFQGGVTDYFGGFFTDMWRCEQRRGIGDNVEYWVQTRKTVKSELKCSVPEMPTEINVTKSSDLVFNHLKGLI